MPIDKTGEGRAKPVPFCCSSCSWEGEKLPAGKVCPLCNAQILQKTCFNETVHPKSLLKNLSNIVG